MSEHIYDVPSRRCARPLHGGRNVWCLSLCDVCVPRERLVRDCITAGVGV